MERFFCFNSTDTNSAVQREFWMAWTASSAVSFPMRSASLRSRVITMGVRSRRLTYCWQPPRFTLTTNLVFIIACIFPQKEVFRFALARQPQPGTTPLVLRRFCGVLPSHPGDLLVPVLLCADSYVQPSRVAFADAAVLSDVY